MCIFVFLEASTGSSTGFTSSDILAAITFTLQSTDIMKNIKSGVKSLEERGLPTRRTCATFRVLAIIDDMMEQKFNIPDEMIISFSKLLHISPRDRYRIGVWIDKITMFLESMYIYIYILL